MKISICLAGAGLLMAGSACAAPALPDASPCSPWVNSVGGHRNAETPGLGCTNRRNLQNMLENRGDFEHGRELGPADAERESLAIKNYREGNVKGPGSPSSSATSSVPMPGAAPPGNAQ